MRESFSLPSLQAGGAFVPRKVGLFCPAAVYSNRVFNHELFTASVQARLQDAHAHRRREKLCRVEASMVERTTQRLGIVNVKAEGDARAAKRSAAVAQQVLETRSRVSVQLAAMSIALPEEQANLLAPSQGVACEQEEVWLERRGLAQERAAQAASKMTAMRHAAAAQVQRERVARARLRDAAIQSERVQAELIAAADGRGPRRARVKPKLTAEERAARRRAAAEQSEAAVRLQAAIRGRNQRRSSLRARAALQRRIAAEVEVSGAADDLAAAEKAATAARAQVAKRFAARSVFTTEAAMKQLEEAEAVVSVKAAVLEQAHAKVRIGNNLAFVRTFAKALCYDFDLILLGLLHISCLSIPQVNAAMEAERAVARAEEEERERRAAEVRAAAARAEAEEAKEAAIRAEMEELRVLDLMEQRRRTEEKKKEQLAEMERAKARMAEQTRRRMQVEASTEQTRRRRVQVETAYGEAAQSKKDVLVSKKNQKDPRRAGTSGLTTKCVKVRAAGPGGGPVDGAASTDLATAEEHASNTIRAAEGWRRNTPPEWRRHSAAGSESSGLGAW